jgi:hypothetical protein
MSILLNTPSRNHVSSSRSTLWFGCYFVTVMIGGAFLGGWLIRWGLQNGSGAWHDLIVEHGPARILRRFQTLCAVLLAPWMLKKIGWQGFRDLGWHSGQSRQARKQDFVRWFLIGLLAMCSLFGRGKRRPQFSWIFFLGLVRFPYLRFSSDRTRRGHHRRNPHPRRPLPLTDPCVVPLARCGYFQSALCLGSFYESHPGKL